MAPGTGFSKDPLTMSLKQYRQKRHFQKTPEPMGGHPITGCRQYLIQKHDASQLHYDFRLELGRGHDWTNRFPSIATELDKLRSDDIILDGEIVVLRPDGTSDFQALQNVMRHGNDGPIVFFVFDLLYICGHDLQ